MTTLDRETLKQAARDHAWDEGKVCEHCDGQGTIPGGRKLVHTNSLNGFPADWDLDRVLEYIDRADSLLWIPGFFGPALFAAVGTEEILFEISSPERTEPF